MLLTDEGEPESFEETQEDTNSRKWLSAMQDDMDSLHENHTYELVELPKGKRALEEEIYMQQPEGFEKKGKEHLVSGTLLRQRRN